MKQIVAIWVVMLALSACKSKPVEDKTAEKPKASQQKSAPSAETAWKDSYEAIVTLESFDKDRILESGQAFFVAPDLVAAKYSLVNQATRVVLKSISSGKKYESTSFVAFDRSNDLIILKVDSANVNPIKLYKTEAARSLKTLYISKNSKKTIQLFSGKLLNLENVRGTQRYRVSNRILASNFGMPIFVSTQKAIGIGYSATVDYQMQSFVIPSFFIQKLLDNRKEKPESLEGLKITANAKVAAANKKIKGLVLETDAGNITIKLFNETAAYRDNFIRLARENYFDSLLIHRVIADFGIQSGAADTRYAKPGESVGWKGPGYTIPAHVVDGLYHQRGMIGSPRKPDTRNSRRRSDGSQFYIVSGRKYTDSELNDLEEKNSYKFSAAQRKTYKTVGGAPHLDGSYTVFGRVTSGMNIVDKIQKVETDDRWRPVKDIRIKRVRILE